MPSQPWPELARRRRRSDRSCRGATVNFKLKHYPLCDGHVPSCPRYTISRMPHKPLPKARPTEHQHLIATCELVLTRAPAELRNQFIIELNKAAKLTTSSLTP